MTRADKARRILEILDELVPDPPIPLTHKDPYTLLVAVVLSAQTTDERVNMVTPGLFARADNPHDMAKLPVRSILAEIKTCGLAPSKAKNIRALSQQLLDLHDGKVPGDFESLEALPGVGHKTASVVLGQAFGMPAFPVDTHVHRAAARWNLSQAKNVEQTEADLKKLFPRERWNQVGLQIIMFGRRFCPARGHELSSCPICGWAATKRRIREEAAKQARPRTKKTKKS